MSAASIDTHREVALALLSLMPRMAKLMGRVSREHGTLSLGRMKVLFLLAESPRRPGDLAQSFGLTRSTVTELIDGLAEDGFVRREEDPSDRRALMVSLAPSGRREIQRFRQVAATELAKVFAHLEPSTRERIRAALGELERAFAAHESLEGRHVR